MTQLQRELTRELEISREIFKQELLKVTTTYEANMKKIANGYQKILDDQKLIIDQQNQSLSKYENLPSSLQVNLREEPLEKLREQINMLENSINSMGKEYGELTSALETLQQKL